MCFENRLAILEASANPLTAPEFLGMDHILIAFLGFNLLVGVGVIAYAIGAYRLYQKPYLKWLIGYVGFFNAMILVAYLNQYFFTNFVHGGIEEAFQFPMILIPTVLLILVWISELGFSYCLYRTAADLKGKSITRWSRRLMLLWAVGFGLANFFGMALTYRTSNLSYFYWIHAGWIGSLIIIILGVLISGLVLSRRNGEANRSLRSFAWIFLAGHLLFIFSQLDFYWFHTGVEKYFDPLLLLIQNLCPLIWLRFFYVKQVAVPSIEEKRRDQFDRFCNKHDISRREREIIDLILAGKSNKEIENTLFISVNTVKNHIYSIYQKVGVQSRSQLIHLLTRPE